MQYILSHVSLFDKHRDRQTSRCLHPTRLLSFLHSQHECSKKHLAMMVSYSLVPRARDALWLVATLWDTLSALSGKHVVQIRT